MTWTPHIRGYRCCAATAQGRTVRGSDSSSLERIENAKAISQRWSSAASMPEFNNGLASDNPFKRFREINFLTYLTQWGAERLLHSDRRRLSPG
jgi:hypothetical protein